MYWPFKYYKGLSTRKASQRKKEISARSKLSWKTQKAYRPFKTDKGVKTKTSKYSARFHKMFPDAHSLPLIKESYNRGMAAWRTGHRPGATQQQWGYARVASMLTCGKTYRTTDSDLVKKAKKTAKGKAWYRKTCRS